MLLDIIDNLVSDKTEKGKNNTNRITTEFKLKQKNHIVMKNTYQYNLRKE